MDRRSITKDYCEILHSNKFYDMPMESRFYRENDGVGILPDGAILVIRLCYFGGEQDIDIAAGTHARLGCRGEGIGESATTILLRHLALLPIGIEAVAERNVKLRAIATTNRRGRSNRDIALA